MSTLIPTYEHFVPTYERFSTYLWALKYLPMSTLVPTYEHLSTYLWALKYKHRRRYRTRADKYEMYKSSQYAQYVGMNFVDF